MTVKRLSEWRTPASAYPRCTHGVAAIGTHYWTPGNYYHNYYQSPPGDDEKYQFIKAERRLRITDLRIRGDTWMVDDPPHWSSIQRSAAIYSGHVLCAGLGLGLIVHALAANPKVEAITVVERERDVIDLIRPLVPACNIVHADWHEYAHDGPVGGVFFDLFVGDSDGLLGLAILTMAGLARRHPGVPIRILGFPFTEPETP